MEQQELLQTKGAEEIAPLLDAKDVARILKISVKTVHKRVREDKLQCVQGSPKDRKFTREQVRLFISTQSVKAFARIKSVSTAQDERVGGLE